MKLGDIPVLNDFRHFTDFNRHQVVPDNWTLYATDVKNSTQAIAAGRYKEVNIVAASGIMAVMNAVAWERIPYVFGGDGVTLLAPPELSDVIGEALVGTQRIAEERFKLDLRVGKIPLHLLRAQGAEVRVARVEISRHLTETILSGAGIALAEKWLKQTGTPNPYLIQQSATTAEANFSGLECRWEPVKSKRGRMVSVVLRATSSTQPAQKQVYDRFLNGMDEILGADGFISPLSTERLALSRNFGAYAAETKLQSVGKGRIGRLVHQVKLFLFTRVVAFFWNTLYKSTGDRYKNEVVVNSDYVKFDGGLKFLFDASLEQIEKLERLLETEHLLGNVDYGIHKSDSALLTCLIFDRAEGDHVHLIDGDNGGYTQAAANLKSRAAVATTTRATGAG